MTIQVKSPGLLSTIQDAGRYGYAHLGISPAGAADQMALRIANRLVGNDEHAAALEMTLIGATLEFDEPCVVALTGGESDCRLGDAGVAMWEAVRVRAREVLACGVVKSGARIYLAVEGGFDVPLILGSACTNLDGRFGGVSGRSLRKGDLLATAKRPAQGGMKLKAGARHQLYPAAALRVTRGPQKEWFGADTFENLLSCAYRVSEESNRSGLRLRGAPLKPRGESQLITEGVALGSVQVPPDGQPIILFVDQQTTGGYPKIGNVIAADMHRVGQLRPRDEVRFEEVTIPEAVRLLREQEEWLRQSLVPSLAT